MRTAILVPVLLALCAACASPAPAAGPAEAREPVASEPADPSAQRWASWPALTSGAGRWIVRYRFTQDPPPRGELFGVEAYVFDARASETPRTDVELLVDAGMLEHGHGMTKAAVHSRASDGCVRADGLRFHMVGRWQVSFDIVLGPRVERAQLDLELE